jgi:YD repeat-containing protein
VGNLLTKTDRKNQLITYTYDQLNRLTQKAYPDTTAVNYTYDNDTHRGGIGQAPSGLPIYMLPQGAVPKPKPTQFTPQ